MNSEERPMKAATTARMRRPLIIGHNCGYIGYDEQPYSRAATVKAYRDCDYLEIDLTLEKVGGKKVWWYYHPGVECKYRRGVKGKRKYGISFDDFLADFRIAARKSGQALPAAKVKSKPGIFLDLKMCLCQRQVNNLMEYINGKYEKKLIPEGTPLMIFTGRDALQAVYRHTTLYFVKWLSKNEKTAILNRRFCPRLTLVTRQIDKIKGRGLLYWKGILERFTKSSLSRGERVWFRQNFNTRFHWAFNPELFWLLKYKFGYIIDNEITVIPWFESNISKFRKFLSRRKRRRRRRFFFRKLLKWRRRKRRKARKRPIESEIADMARIAKKLPETDEGWIKVIVGLLGKYWLYRGGYPRTATWIKPLRWGIITYAPSLLKDALEKYSFPARLVRRG